MKSKHYIASEEGGLLVDDEAHSSWRSSQTLSSPIAHARAGRFLYYNNIYQHTDGAMEAERILAGNPVKDSDSNTAPSMEYSANAPTYWSRFTDKGFALAFLLFMGFFLYMSLKQGRILIEHGGLSQPFTDASLNPSIFGLAFFVFIVNVLVGSMSLAFLQLYRWQPRAVMRTSVAVYAGVMVLFTLVSLVAGRVPVVAAMFAVAMIVIVVLWWLMVRHRVDAVTLIIEASLRPFLSNFKNLLQLAVYTSSMSWWLLVYSICSAAILSQYGMLSVGAFDAEQVTAVSGQAGVVVMLILGLYWSTQVIRNIMYSAFAGTFAAYWLLPSFVHADAHAGALHRACTYNLGSICFGSLVVAVVSSLRSGLRFFTKDEEQNLAQLCINCLLSLLEGALKYFNNYAYSYMSIYGGGYIDSASKCCDLFQTRGVDVAAKDDIAAMPLFLANASISMSVGAIIFGAGHFVWELPSHVLYIYVALAMALSVILAGHVLSIVECAISTSYIVWAELPAEMREVQPEAFKLLNDGHKEFN